MTNTDALNLGLMSLLMGGGSYAALRGVRDIGGPPKPQPPENELEVTLPSSKIPKTPTFEKFSSILNPGPEAGPSEIALANGLNTALPLFIGGAGLYGGFRGASKLYENYEGDQIQNDQDKAKKDYLKSLQHASTKIGSLKTPNVDKFLNGYIDKLAENDISQNSIMDNLWNATRDKGQELWDKGTEAGGQFLNDTAKRAAGSKPVGWGMGALAGLTGATGLATYYLANRLDANREEAKRKSVLPTEVRLNVQ